ncbi:Putative uncharacterized protein [Thermobacillus xylanilyticus]|jgi:hypothetical protein|uniref:DUF4007 domain-containing protein n=1 Tax=Thermobacillus xylanilyticus TaxID=76633 RepID=A0ABN7RWI7_THEXY|nr:DUF4007 family protein [Thermobacillus xylanilyticus]CAG5087787.1 Putative uncharacterized protein [Thermobacillus xylanilyticus]
MKFGHHQSFYLRVNWLSKAFKAIESDPRFFYDDHGFEKIGLGRNMVKSLKYWSTAVGIMSEKKNEERKPVHVLTPIGELIKQHDRFVRRPLTAAVLHYLLASSKEQATSWYWFFNVCNLRSASADEVLESLNEWVFNEFDKSVSIQSLKRDIECIRQLYTSRSAVGDDPEEVVASPFSSLNLLADTKQGLVKQTPDIQNIGLDALYFSLLVYGHRHQVNSVTWEELQVKPLLWGRMYHLTSQQILEVLELLHAEPYYPLTFVRTNQLYTLNFELVEPHQFLQKAYEREAAV